MRTRSSTGASKSRALLSSSSSLAGAPAVQCLQQLRHLDLSWTDVPVSSLQQLVRATGLTYLRFHFVDLTRSDSCRHKAAAQEQAEAMTAMLMQLQHLKQLSLGTSRVLHGLMQAMPASLTSLHLRGVRGMRLDATAAAQLSSLIELRLDCFKLKTGLLESMPQVQHLELEFITTKPRRLLAAIGQMSQLRHLHLQDCNLTDVDSDSMSSLTALTASQHLTALHIKQSLQSADGDCAVLPKCRLQHMLAPGRRLPALRVLHVGVNVGDSFWGWFAYGHLPSADYSTCCDALDVAHIAECCPALSCLDLRYALCDAAAVSALTQLRPSLERLAVGGPCFGNTAAAAVAQLTGLQQLHWDCSLVTMAGLQQLTVLKGLTALQLSGWKQDDAGVLLRCTTDDNYRCESDKAPRILVSCSEQVALPSQAVCRHQQTCQRFAPGTGAHHPMAACIAVE